MTDKLTKSDEMKLVSEVSEGVEDVRGLCSIVSTVTSAGHVGRRRGQGMDKGCTYNIDREVHHPVFLDLPEEIRHQLHALVIVHHLRLRSEVRDKLDCEAEMRPVRHDGQDLVSGCQRVRLVFGEEDDDENGLL